MTITDPPAFQLVDVHPDQPYDGVLICPWCRGEFTHIDEVSAGTRHEDGPIRPMTFDAVEGELRKGTPGSRDRTGRSPRRHWIEVHVDCEQCPGGAIVFVQHKGETQVAFVANPKPVTVRVPR